MEELFDVQIAFAGLFAEPRSGMSGVHRDVVGLWSNHHLIGSHVGKVPKKFGTLVVGRKKQLNLHIV